jgi:hypothetical protein
MEKLDRVRRVATRWGIKAGRVKDQPNLHTFGEGGSLDTWRRYLGPDASMVGIDIDQRCADRLDPPNLVRIGSQADRVFLEGVVAEFGNEWDGGYRRRGTAIEMAKSLVGDLHAWCHQKGSGPKAHKDVGSVHFHDSVIVIEKHRRQRPGQMSPEGGKKP